MKEFKAKNRPQFASQPISHKKAGPGLGWPEMTGATADALLAEISGVLDSIDWAAGSRSDHRASSSASVVSARTGPSLRQAAASPRRWPRRRSSPASPFPPQSGFALAFTGCPRRRHRRRSSSSPAGYPSAPRACSAWPTPATWRPTLGQRSRAGTRGAPTVIQRQCRTNRPPADPIEAVSCSVGKRPALAFRALRLLARLFTEGGLHRPRPGRNSRPPRREPSYPTDFRRRPRRLPQPEEGKHGALRTRGHLAAGYLAATGRSPERAPEDPHRRERRPQRRQDRVLGPSQPHLPDQEEPRGSLFPSRDRRPGPRP